MTSIRYCLIYLFGERQRSGDAPLVARTQQRIVGIFFIDLPIEVEN